MTDEQKIPAADAAWVGKKLVINFQERPERLRARPADDATYATWPTKQQAARTIGVSVKTIENFTQAGLLEHVLWRRPQGGQRVAVYNPEQVAHLAQQRRPVVPDARDRQHLIAVLARQGEAIDALRMACELLRASHEELVRRCGPRVC